MALFECIHSYNTQRRLRLIVFITALISLILSWLSVQRCTFILSGATSDPDSKMYAWGLFTTPVYDHEHHIQGCIPYPSSVVLGPSVKTAQAFGILLVILEASIFLGFFLVHFFLERGTSTIYHIIKVFLPSAFICQILTFSSFASKFCTEIVDELDEEGGTMPATCVPGGAGVVGIFNLVAIILMTTLMSMVVPPEHPVFQLYGTGNDNVRRIKRQKVVPQAYDYPTKPPKRSSHRSKKTREKPSRQSYEKPPKQRGVDSYSYREPQRPGKDKVKITIVNGPDVRKTIKEITHPDGSQTITTTVEELRNSFDEDESVTLDDDASTIIEVV